MINPELKKDDKIVLLSMSDFSVDPYTKGIVERKVDFAGSTIYTIKWEDGSNYNLLSDVDKWMMADDFEKKFKKQKKDITEDYSSEIISKNIDILKYFNWKFLQKYLIMVRDSGITNMFGAAPYLYIGKNKIEQEIVYKDLDSDDLEDVLENAEQAREEMIRGTVKYLEANNKEVNVENVQRFLPRFAIKIVENYTILY